MSDTRYCRIGDDVRLGENVVIYDFVNLYGCVIGDNATIGTFVEIQRNAKVGKNCKISTHTFICEGVTIEDDVFVGHGVEFINDNYPKALNAEGCLQTENDWEVLPSIVRRGASIGSGATILGGVTIGEKALVGAGSVVTKDVPPNTVVVGNPARVLRKIDAGGSKPDTAASYCSILKRAIDIASASIGLFLLSPLLLLISLLIKLETSGPVFHRGLRVGKDGKSFRMFKFRTMVVHGDKTGSSSTAIDDPRITKIGRLIRRHNLDELPQFINVLKGEMSIVGPRPQVPWAVELYTEEEKAILNMRPGITDWATLWVRDEGEILRGSKDPDSDYMEKIWPEKRRLQLRYVRDHNVWKDFHIMLMTLKIHFVDRIMSGPRSQDTSVRRG